MRSVTEEVPEVLTNEQALQAALASTEKRLAKAVRLSQEAMKLMTDDQLAQLQGILEGM